METSSMYTPEEKRDLLSVIRLSRHRRVIVQKHDYRVIVLRLHARVTRYSVWCDVHLSGRGAVSIQRGGDGDDTDTTSWYFKEAMEAEDFYFTLTQAWTPL